MDSLMIMTGMTESMAYEISGWSILIGLVVSLVALGVVIGKRERQEE